MAMSAGGHFLYPSELKRSQIMWTSLNFGFRIAVVLNPWLVHFTF